MQQLVVKLTSGADDPDAPSYFPAYRRGEFSPGLARELRSEEVG